MADDNRSDSSAGGDNENDWSDWEDEAAADAKCPFCSFTGSPSSTFAHCTEQHSFDFYAIRKQLGLDFYGCMRLVNYVRKTSISAADILSQPTDWTSDDQYLAPVLSDDPLLYAFDQDEDDEDDRGLTSESLAADAALAESAAMLTASDSKIVKALLAELRASHAKAEQLSSAFREYKEQVRQNFLEGQGASNADLDKPAENLEDEWEMDGYFGSYATTDIHETMLKDTIRTDAYRNFIYNNKAYFKGKVVLDVGCGTGILSMFAARAGAKMVIAVDNSTIIKKARAIAAANGLDGIITFIAGKIEDIPLPVDKVDVIVSEWMGYFLLFEGMLDSVLVARDRYLAPDGIMAPSHAIIKIAGLEDAEWVNDRLHFWNDVYGFKMDVMKKEFLSEGQVDFADAQGIITSEQTVSTINTQTATVASLDFECDYSLVATRDGTMHAICSWFDIEFRGALVETETFSTGPLTKGTHWKQTMFVFDEPFHVLKGDVIEGRFTGIKSKENHRDMVATVTVNIPSRGVKGYSKTFHVR
ncbi:S-adenosyl-L-methionine-dependent methyltransferase [Entophlyctis helioformis]|nr:S-adenosyl-L-methionine-dependent methyltransferase [Entophlyctis helioformis]